LLIDNKSIKLILINKLPIKTITTITINKTTKHTIKKYLNYKNNIKLSNKLIRYENKNIKIINNEKIIFKSLFEN
jgi:predicted AAA+ superfamily ATPase